ncbi:ABC transporter permease [Paenibacillus pasadenensis]|uniref:ABC transporter permease n=1 Tax=Paenibacillus pasadenensis TaxID=217090 RepID=UPI00203CF3E1|nr:ABC transporter permease [Paenibacillus pasadenensis]MCM3750329.1 ABC transporter permease [Paenibacillus pasadenensis]
MSLTSFNGAIELGLIFALMALGVYITYRILDFPDLTVDGSFTTGAAISVIMIGHGYPALIATLAGMAGGMIAGVCTGLLHTKGKINGLLAGILMMIALYSINLRIMDKPNVPVKVDEGLLGGFIRSDLLTAGGVSWIYAVVLSVVVAIIWLLLVAFFKTDMGLSLRATGDNKRMIRSFGGNTDRTTIIGVSLSNGLVALSGALIAQDAGFADNSMGIGMIVIGLASVIIGEAIFGSRGVLGTTLAVIVGAVVYRVVIAAALNAEWLNLETSDLKLITAVIVIIALVVPTVSRSIKQKRQARLRTAELARSGKGGL